MQEITTETQFQQLLLRHRIVVLVLYSDYCKPCKVIAPSLEELANANAIPNKVVFVKSNTSLNLFPVKGVPSIRFFVDRRMVHEVLGADLEQVRINLQKVLPVVKLEGGDEPPKQKTDANEFSFRPKRNDSCYKSYASYST